MYKRAMDYYSDYLGSTSYIPAKEEEEDKHRF